MKIIGDTAYIGCITGIEPNGDFITVTEHNGAKVCLPLDVVLRCHAIAKHECENAGLNWDAECKRVLEQEGVERLKANFTDLKAKTLLFLKASPGFTAKPGEIRAHLGLPIGGTSSARSFSDCFRRNLMDKLVAEGVVKMEGSTRDSVYRLTKRGHHHSTFTGPVAAGESRRAVTLG